MIAVGSPVPPRRQERARVACLKALTWELHSRGITDLLIEARTADLDARDVATVLGVRYGLPKGSQLRLSHQPGVSELLLWIADVAAGAVRTHHQGQPAYGTLLAERLHEIDVTTGL